MPAPEEPEQAEPENRPVESQWQRQLREATARLDAVGLPAPAASTTVPPPPIRRRRTEPPADPAPRRRAAQEPWRPDFWSRRAVIPDPAAEREARMDAGLAHIADLMVRERARLDGRDPDEAARTAPPPPTMASEAAKHRRKRNRVPVETAEPIVLPGPGDLVLAAGVGVTGLPVVRYLAGTGASVVVSSNRPAPPELAAISGAVTFAGDLQAPPDGTTLVVTSAGIPPTNPLLAAALLAGIEVIGEVELAWRIDQASGAPRDWLVVTGTNGKTTTTGMLEAILRADNRRVTASGNIGWPVLEAVLAGRESSIRSPDDPDGEPVQEVIAVELSSFQLHWAPSVRPAAGVVLNVAEDHLDWHGSMAAYAAAKARALTGRVALAVIDDPGAAALLRGSPAALVVPIMSGRPFPGALGVRHGSLVDAAFGADVLLDADQVRPAGEHNLTNALAAAGLALAVGVRADAISAGLQNFTPGGHRNVLVAELAGVRYFDDSKATNPHAALASLQAYDRVVWIAGGQLKGATVDDLVRRVSDRLAGAVLLGVDAPIIAAALSRHAPDVPVQLVPGKDDDVMRTVVSAAATMAAPGDVVLLAPAAASLDMFSSYAARGNAFAAAANALGDDR
ncbi:MAG: UDP-N-acetylmuramoyl-L-alanine--D-glutamate ligase [Nakamurella sp.]